MLYQLSQAGRVSFFYLIASILNKTFLSQVRKRGAPRLLHTQPGAARRAACSLREQGAAFSPWRGQCTPNGAARRADRRLNWQRSCQFWLNKTFGFVQPRLAPALTRYPLAAKLPNFFVAKAILWFRRILAALL